MTCRTRLPFKPGGEIGMPKFLLKRWHGLHMIWTFILLFLVIAVLFVFSWVLGLLALIPAAVLVYYTIAAENAFRRELNNYVLTLSYRIKRMGNEVIHELPIGILLYNEDKLVEWHNPFVANLFGRDSLVGEPLFDLFPMLRNRLDKHEMMEFRLQEHYIRVIIKAEERLLYFMNITDYADLARKYEEEKISLGIVMLDNMEEVTQGMDDQTRSILQAKTIAVITEWANRYGIYMRRVASDKFMLIMNRRTLKEVEASKFDILDDVKDTTSDYKLPMTLSIGIASDAGSLIELGQLAQTSLDIALGRGGDQAAVRIGQELFFYGGRSNAVEKRTRVRARVIAHALRDLIKDSDHVVIMGHRLPDMDALGAGIGMLKAAQLAGKDAYLVLERDNPGIVRLLDEMRQHEHLAKRIVTPEQAMQITTPQSLAVVVDTHKPSLVQEPRILQTANRIVVIDHHRRGEEFIQDPTLVYIEPYASSTCELVAELLQYMHDRITVGTFEATALLAGITVDTKSFSFQTGSRTFEAASFLRRQGADPMMVQSLLKEDLKEFNMKAELISRAEILFGNIAVAAARPDRKYSQLIIAQAADALLSMNGVAASFVIGERAEGGVGISARSLGQLNVQLVMEKLGGGGHLTNAAVQLEVSVEEAKQRLIRLLEEMKEEERSLE